MATNMTMISKKPLYKKMDGIIYPAMFSEKCFRETLDYKPRCDDIFIVTYPKCGTTWIQSVAMYIFRKGKELEHLSQYRKHCPFIDLLGQEGINKMLRPGALKTHLPYSHLPYSPEAKYIFVARNPKDCVVSFYHHARNDLGFGFWEGKFDDFFEIFMAGEVEYNDYFDHLLSWYPHRNDRNVFFTTYEEMKTNIKKVIVDLAKFLGEEFIDAIERDHMVLNNIVLYSSFDYMQKQLSNLSLTNLKDEELLSELNNYEGIRFSNDFVAKIKLPDKLSERNFFRKGIVGDWKNVLTDEQNRRINEKFIEKTKGTEIPAWFSLY